MNIVYVSNLPSSGSAGTLYQVPAGVKYFYLNGWMVAGVSVSGNNPAVFNK